AEQEKAKNPRGDDRSEHRHKRLLYGDEMPPYRLIHIAAGHGAAQGIGLLHRYGILPRSVAGIRIFKHVLPLDGITSRPIDKGFSLPQIFGQQPALGVEELPDKVALTAQIDVLRQFLETKLPAVRLG